MAENTTEMICINCPRGCMMQITKNGNDISVSGSYCSKGVTYAKQEVTSPQRVLTVLMRPEGAERPLSVRTDRPVPKELLKKCARTIYGTHPNPPVKYGDILIENLCGTGANVIATADMEKQ